MSPLHTELIALRRASKRTDQWMAVKSAEFFAHGGVCCPYCGVPGYSEASSKQERRENRIEQIVAKLDRDSGAVPARKWRVTLFLDGRYEYMELLGRSERDVRQYVEQHAVITEEGASIVRIKRVKNAV